MRQEEKELETRCRAYARARGWVACKLEKNGNKGIPDDLFISPSGECVLVEFKKNDRQKLRREQKLWLEKYPQLVHVVSDFYFFSSMLERLEERRKGEDKRAF